MGGAALPTVNDSTTPLELVIADVVTMDASAPRVEAFATLGGAIIAVGELGEVRRAAPGARETRLDGTVTPGLIDAHLHMERGGLKALDQLDPAVTLEEFPTGMLSIARGPDWSRSAPPTLDERVRAIERIQAELHALGFTGIVDPAATIEEVRGYQEAHRRGRLTMRTVAMPYSELGHERIPDVDAAIAHLEGTGVSTGFGDDRLRIGPIKIYFDGEGMKGEALLPNPWNAAAVAAGTERPYFGEQRIADADFERLVRYCVDSDWGVGVHAVGGGAVAKILSLFSSIAAEHPIDELRFQIIHAYLETPQTAIEQAARSGVIASLQPSLIWTNGAALRERIGERAERANPVRSWIDAGAVVAFGSDGPYFEFDPRQLIWQAVTRRVAGSDIPLDPSESITVHEGFAAYTTGAAYAALAEHRRGAIRAGLLADWVLWDADPTTMSAEELRRARVLRTVIGGRPVFEAGES